MCTGMCGCISFGIKREGSSKIDAKAGHRFVCFIPQQFQADLVRNCGCFITKE